MHFALSFNVFVYKLKKEKNTKAKWGWWDSKNGFIL
jgi:hypothetical protein